MYVTENMDENLPFHQSILKKPHLVRKKKSNQDIVASPNCFGVQVSQSSKPTVT